MSDLFTEALRDAQKLREVAEEDAKNSIIEQITPYIKKVIAKEASGASDFFFEQEDEEDVQQQAAPQPADQQGMGGDMATTQEPQTTDPMQGDDLGAGLGDQPEAAPVAPEGEEAAEEEEVEATMPDEEGKITVDFEDLFADQTPGDMEAQGGAEAPPVEPQAEPQTQTPATTGDQGSSAPVGAQDEDLLEPQQQQPTATESLTWPEYRRVLSNVSEKVDRVYFSESASDITKETLRQRLMDLLEAVDIMRDKGLITGKQAKINENKLEFLYLKLKEAGLNHSYNKEQDKDSDMTTLKEFAAKLFEEDENLAKDAHNSGDTGVPTDDEYSTHAADVSGVDPNLGDTDDVEVAQEDKPLAEEMLGGTAGSVDEEPISDEMPGENQWADGEPSTEEEEQPATQTKSVSEASAAGETPTPDSDVAEGHAGFGDTTEEPTAEFEVDDEELAEAVRSIRKETIKRKLAELHEASDGAEEKSWEDADPEGGEDPSQKNLKEGLEESELGEGGYMMSQDELPGDEDEDMEDVEAVTGGEEELPGEELPGEGAEEEGGLEINVDLPPEVEDALSDAGVEELDATVEVEAGEDEMEGPAGEEEEMGAEELEGEELGAEEVPGSEEEDMVMTDMAYESKYKHAARKAKLLEQKLEKAKKLLEKKNGEAEELRKQLAETNLFTSKAVYYSKFLQRALSEQSLSKKSLKQIVEHLDKGRSVAETKAIYNKIKQKLDEHVTASRKLDGSSSKVAKPGSASLNESAGAGSSEASGDAQSPSRWQELAGIKARTE